MGSKGMEEENMVVDPPHAMSNSRDTMKTRENGTTLEVPRNRTNHKEEIKETGVNQTFRLEECLIF